MNFLSRLFRPKEVRDVLFALDMLDKTPLANIICYHEIKERASKALTENVAVVREQIIVEGQKPLYIALNLIINLCGADLRSGSDHLYRGVLSMRGTAKRALFWQAQEMLVKRGIIDQNDADEGKAILVEQIREAG